MGAEGSLKRKKNSKKKREEDLDMGSYQLGQGEGNLYGGNKEEKNNKKKKKKSPRDSANEIETKMLGSPDNKDETHELSEESKKSKKRKNKRKTGKIMSTAVEESDNLHSNEDEDGISGKVVIESEPAEDKLLIPRKKKRKNVGSVNKLAEFHEKDDVSEHQSGKSKNSKKTKKTSQLVENKTSPNNLLEKRDENEEDDVYQMSSGDEDYSKGMQKWIMQYHQSRPGLKVLQERIDDFIAAHETKEEQARVEREAQAAEGGWTVVVHHKGRKKTTEAESGVAVGSVAAAAVLDKMGRKKKKDVGVDFYRFQKREAHRNEIMMLQSKFEQDKKRIQQMRAERKFRPY